jgi:RHS repeat-associated protein
LTDDFASVGRTTYSYDALDRLTTVTRSAGGVAGPQVVFGYDLASNRTSLSRTVGGAGTAVNTTYSYDALDRLTTLTHQTGTGTSLAGFSYAYDSASRLTAETVNGAAVTYGYDSADQLTGVSGARSEAYTYDANGNRSMAGYTIGAGNRVLAAATAAGNMTYTYDAEGNRTAQTNTTTGAVTTYAYDQRDRLTGVTIKASGGATTYQVTYTYDALDRRIGERSGGGTTWTVYDGREEYADVDGSGTLQARYLQGPAVDELLARTDASGATSWYLTDRQGSVRNVASSSGSVVGTITYDGYGRQLANTGATDKFGYTGLATDPNTGLAKTDHRYYDAAIGSWTQQDPIGFAGGDPDLYGYVGNSPTNRSDPSGLDWYDYIPWFGGPIVCVEALYVGGRESARGMELDEQRAQLLLAEQERSTATEMMLDPLQTGQMSAGSYLRVNGRTTQDAMCQYGDATGELKRRFAQAAAEEAAGRGGVKAAGGIFGALGWFFRKGRRVSKGLKATSDLRKFTEYIFKEGADHGKDKVFRGLGYGKEHSQQLAELWEKQAAEKYACGKYSLGKADQYGQRIDIEIELSGIGGAAGKTSYLRSGWMIQPDGSIKLNTPFSGFTR